MPCYDGVFAWRHPGDRIAAVRSADRKEWMLRHGNVRLHPWMLVASDWHQHFGAREFMRQRRSAIGLRLVPIGIALGCEVNIVRRRIAVLDRDRFVNHHAENVRLIMTAILIE